MLGSWDGVKQVLEKAARIIQEDRNKKNGDPEDNFAFIALGWTGALRARGILVDDAELNAADVARLMVILKVMRDANCPVRDNRTDGVGYWCCLERVEPTEED